MAALQGEQAALQSKGKQAAWHCGDSSYSPRRELLPYAAQLAMGWGAPIQLHGAGRRQLDGRSKPTGARPCARTGASGGAAPCMCHACAMHAMHMARMHMHQVRALCHEAVQHVVKGEDVSIRREGHLEEARGYAHFAIDTLSLHLPGQEAMGLDQLVSIEHLPASHLLVSRPATLSERAARAAGSTSLSAGLTSRRHSNCTSGRTSGSTSGSSSCLFRASERTATPTRHRNVVRVGFIDAQGGDRSGLDTHNIDICEGGIYV